MHVYIFKTPSGKSEFHSFLNKYFNMLTKNKTDI